MNEGFYKNNTDKNKYSCLKCGLYKNAKTYKMQPYGGYKQRIINIGESSGQEEDEQGVPWVGKVGRILQRTYRRLGIDLFEDCLNVNSVSCRPVTQNGTNKKPTDKQIACCREMVVKNVFKDYDNPDLIVLFGSSALKSFLGHRWGGTLKGISRWRGWVIPDREHNAWVAPVYHPSFIARSEEEIESLWIEDIQRALEHLDKPFPKYKEPEIEFIEDLSPLYKIESDLTAFDFETTGLKPQAQGHRIVSCAIADTPDHVYAFLIPKKRRDQKPLLWYLNNHEIGKVAANLSYENNWSNVRLRQPVKGWNFDVTLASHILDNRGGVSSLDFQVYTRFGIVDYSSKVKPYLESPEGSGGNGFNRIHELLETKEGIEDLLTYNAYDSIYELRIAWEQIKEIDYDFLPTL